MRKKVTRAQFKKISAEEMLARFGTMGFSEYDGGAFGREREGFIQGIGLSPDASMMKFYVTVGVLIPALWGKEDFVIGAHAPMFEISHRLGEFRKNLDSIAPLQAIFEVSASGDR